jgi:hypothetical protein
MAAAERHSIKAWAARLSADGEALTLEEAQLLAAIAAADRLLEMRDAVSDVQARLTRLELYLAATVPGYDPATRALAARLAERSDARTEARS